MGTEWCSLDTPKEAEVVRNTLWEKYNAIKISYNNKHMYVDYSSLIKKNKKKTKVKLLQLWNK